MGTALKNTVVIDTLSQELLFELIETLPIQPYVGNIWFTAEVEPPKHYAVTCEQKKAVEEYERECIQKGIAPHIGADIQYNAENHAFEKKVLYYNRGKTETASQQLEADKCSLEQIIIKGKPSRIVVHTLDGTYDKIKEFVTGLKIRGYHISSGELSLRSSYATTHPRVLDITQIEIGETVRLRIEHEGPDIEKLTQWFNGLKEKYEIKT